MMQAGFFPNIGKTVETVMKPYNSFMNLGPVKAVTDKYDSVVNALSEKMNKITQPLDAYTKSLGLDGLGGSDLETMGSMAEAAGMTEVAGAIGDIAGMMSAAGPLGAIAGEVIQAAETPGISEEMKKQGMSAFAQPPAPQPQQKSMAELARDLEKGTDRKSQRILTMPDLYQQLMQQMYLNEDPNQKLQRYY